ncbi:MAG TPA: hypothetical protein VG223_14935 [Solirubrobacteraceae bacterium]|jgi:hypothetical protein|nr:hypothetical protein [Solirubrobacteraceae bacterium]
MEPPEIGALVTVTGSGPAADGIVFDVLAATKVVVAVMDRVRGPVLRTVNPTVLSERASESEHDPALRLLIRRTPRPSHDVTRSGTRDGSGRTGFRRGAAHRSTGR